MEGENDFMLIEGNSDNFGVKAIASVDTYKRTHSTKRDQGVGNDQIIQTKSSPNPFKKIKNIAHISQNKSKKRKRTKNKILNLQKNSAYWDVKCIEKVHSSSKEGLREKEIPYTSMDTTQTKIITRESQLNQYADNHSQERQSKLFRIK